MNKPPKAMLSEPAAPVPAAPKDKLDAVRAAVAEVRDLRVQKASLEERAKEIGRAIYEAEHKTLPELFDAAQMTKIGLEPAGNLPGFVAEVAPYYHANISADWPEEKRAEAFGWLTKKKHGDLIKTQITVELGRGTEKIRKKVEAFLKKNKIPYGNVLTVPWNTLTAFVKTEVAAGRAVPLDTLGATIGRVVTIKPVKPEK